MGDLEGESRRLGANGGDGEDRLDDIGEEGLDDVRDFLPEEGNIEFMQTGATCPIRPQS